MPSVIAAQLYTLRDFLQTPKEIEASLKKVKQIGYDAVQSCALGPIEPRELAKILQGEGLTCAATHEDFEVMRDEPGRVLDFHQTLACQYSAIGGLPESYRSEDGYHRFAREFSEVARTLKAGGLEVGYHNHHWEFAKFNGKPALQILIEECDPIIHFEIDTYWVQTGGSDPVQWIRQLKGRIPLVHLKDMVYGIDLTTANQLRRNDAESEAVFAYRRESAQVPKPIMAEVGEGNLNFPAILEACRESGVKWYIVEQDTCQRDPFESLAISLRNVKMMGLA